MCVCLCVCVCKGEMIRVTGSASKSNTGKPCWCQYAALRNSLSSDRGAEESVMETVNMEVSRAWVKGQRRTLSLWRDSLLQFSVYSLPVIAHHDGKDSWHTDIKGWSRTCIHKQKGIKKAKVFRAQLHPSHILSPQGSMYVIVCLIWSLPRCWRTATLRNTVEPACVAMV